jgi:hypothetical protein
VDKPSSKEAVKRTSKKEAQQAELKQDDSAADLPPW